MLDRKLDAEAIDQLEMQTGIYLTQPQLIELIAKSGIDKTPAEYGDVDTQIRERLADELSMRLVGRSWPMRASLYNAADKSQIDFASELDEAAINAGYKVH